MEIEVRLRLAYDDSVNAAKLYLVHIEPGEVAHTHVCSGRFDSKVVNRASSIIIDFDANDRLLGIEILDARQRLPERLLTELGVAKNESS